MSERISDTQKRLNLSYTTVRVFELLGVDSTNCSDERMKWVDDAIKKGEQESADIVLDLFKRGIK